MMEDEITYGSSNNSHRNYNSYNSRNEFTLKEALISIKRWFHYLMLKWKVLLIIGITGGLIGLSYSIIKKPVYKATTTFVLEEGGNRGGLMGQYAGLANMVGIDINADGGGIFQGDNILELYKSRNMIQKTLLSPIDIQGRKQLLIDRYIEFHKLREDWKSNPKLVNIHFQIDTTKNTKSQEPVPTNKSFTRLQDSIIGSIVKNIKKKQLKVTKADKNLNIILVELKSKDESFAKAFNDQIVKNVNDFYIQSKTKKSLNTIAILQQKTDSVRNSMFGAISSAASAIDATPNLNLARQAQRIVPVQRSQFTTETNKAMLSELIKNLELSKISLVNETPLIQVIDQPIFPLEKSHISKAMGFIIGAFIALFIGTIILLLNKISQQ